MTLMPTIFSPPAAGGAVSCVAGGVSAGGVAGGASVGGARSDFGRPRDGAAGVGDGGGGSWAASRAAPKLVSAAVRTAASPIPRRKRSAPLCDRLALAGRHAQALGPDANLDRLEPLVAGCDQELRNRVL